MADLGPNNDTWRPNNGGWRMANNGRMVAGQMAMDKDGGETTPMDRWRQEKKKKKEEKEGSGWE